ncbi:MAG: hypothetical protein GDA48_00190 [Hormoscilla sp. GM102CHS1]|nr:hypothetical protein [Hormoscilla sp. GM102CHS1]
MDNTCKIKGGKCYSLPTTILAGVSRFIWGDRDQKYVEIARAYEDAIENLGPDDFFTLTGAIENNCENFSTE